MLSHSVMSDSLQPHGLQTTRVLCPGGFSRQEYWSGLLCPPPGDLPDPGIEPRSLMSPTLQADSLPSEPPGKPTRMFIVALFMIAKWFTCPADEQTKPSIPIGWNIQLRRAIKSWFMLQHEWTLEMKLFTSNWDLDPHGWDSSTIKPKVFQLISNTLGFQDLRKLRLLMFYRRKNSMRDKVIGVLHAKWLQFCPTLCDHGL